MDTMPPFLDPSHDVENGLVFKVAGNQAEREAAFRLIYHSYLRTGLIRANPYELRVTPYNLLPTTEVFVAKHRDEVVCTVSLVGDGDLGLPMESIYPDEIAALRGQGGVLAEVSGLADRRRDIERFFPMFLRLVRVLCPYARCQGINQLVVAVHPRHGRFYQRYLKFDRFGDEKLYPEVCDHPAVPLVLDFLRLQCNWPSVYDLLFGETLSEGQLEPQPMLEWEKRRLSGVARWHAGAESAEQTITLPPPATATKPPAVFVEAKIA